ncbi:InlB B-repeat-containing protein [Methanolobus bombayensis]|uniref:InlB B-repeat-containing protein n=1 Tax=Methanolobus bombayensis TaxID=38023 RepID=UPI001AE3A4A1|nr:InlB B-repeat-containing protein [Methanolobus bombayensis]MBP1908584.1 putative repeat protein (TIGR02543 family) [Methanolobus bombayensis]
MKNRFSDKKGLFGRSFFLILVVMIFAFVVTTSGCLDNDSENDKTVIDNVSEVDYNEINSSNSENEKVYFATPDDSSEMEPVDKILKQKVLIPITSGSKKSSSSSSGSAGATPIMVTGITVTGTGSATNVILDQTLQMNADVVPASATDKTVLWTVVNGTGNATIDSNGLLTGKALGNITVKATANDASGVERTLQVIVTEPPVLVTGITINAAGSVANVVSGQTLEMNASVLPFNATDKGVTWSVINGTGSATIDVNGLLTAIEVGNLTVKATANDASGVEGSMVVTVDPILVTDISVTGAGSATMIVNGETLQMNADVLPADATDSSVTWSVINGTGNAMIDANGLLSATGMGTVTVKAISNDASATVGTSTITIAPMVYTVSFNKNNGDTDANPLSKNVAEGSTIDSLPSEPTRTGHTFEGWNTESDGSGTSFTTATVVNGDITVYAVWKPISYTVTFNKNGGDVDASPTSDTADYGTTLDSLPAAPTKTGHTFEGWNTESDGSGTSFTTATVVNGDITVYAVWKPISYTVTFDKNGGDVDASPTSDTADYGTTLDSLPAAPTKTGHTFEGWNTESDGSGTSFTTATVVNGDITVYAVWKPISYTVTFDKNGGDVDASPTSDTADYGTTLDSLPAAPTKTGHTFEGWNTQPDGLGSSFTSSTVVTEDITVYATWQLATYTVTFDKNGGDVDASPTSDTADYGTTLDSLPTAPTKTGHTFEGWNTESDGSGTSFTTATVVTGDITVYAMWKPISYTVTFNKNGGDVDASPTSDTADYGTTLDSLPAAPTKTGHTFEGWNTESDGSGTSFTTATVITDDITVYAMWEEIILVPAGTLLDAEQGSDFTGVLYHRNSKLYYNQESNGKWSGESWVGNGTEGRIAIDSSGNIHAAYTTDGKIGYRVFDGSDWNTEELILSNNGGSCSKPDIAVDIDGDAHITYTDTRGQLGGYREKDDIMYANSSTSFDKNVVYNGYYEHWGGADYIGMYYLKGSFITVDSNKNYYILSHQQRYDKSMSYADSYYSVVVKSNLGSGSTSEIYKSGSSVAIYDFITRDGKQYALYKHTNPLSSELSVSGNLISFVNSASIGSATSAYSHDVLSGDIVVGSKDGSNLQTSYNGISATNSSIVVGGNAVSIVNDGANFYVFYTDNADGNIKKMLVLPLAPA